MGILFNQGQVCCAGSRVFVHEDIWDKFLAECVDAFNKVKVAYLGKGYCNGLKSMRATHKILDYVEIGKKKGQRWPAVRAHHRKRAGQGAFMRPTILIDVKNDMRVAQEEIFGQLLSLSSLRQREVIDMANDSEYGLGGAVWLRISTEHCV